MNNTPKIRIFNAKRVENPLHFCKDQARTLIAVRQEQQMIEIIQYFLR